MTRVLFLLTTGLLLAAPLTAEMVAPSLAPVDRLVANLTARLEQHPNDDKTRFALARVHYLAFWLKSSQVSTFGSPNDPLPELAPDWAQQHGLAQASRQEAIRQIEQEHGVDSWTKLDKAARNTFWDEVTARQRKLINAHWQPASLTAAEAADHAAKANDLFGKLIAANPKEPLYRMGRASLWAQLLETEPAGLSAPLNALKATDALDELYLVYQQTAAKDAGLKYQPLWGLVELLSYQAAQAWLKLAKAEDISQPERQKTLEAHLKKLGKLPIGAITPIVLSLEPGRSLSSLLAPETTVSFDLDGDLEPEPRTWLQPDTGLLVWNPDGSPVTTGRQLLGSVTWWIFWDNGYQVLDALDDNRDGELTGPELAGIAVWFDRNSNGRSEPGEIVSLDEAGIVALGVRGVATELGCPKATAGLRLRDGRVLPTWDWIEGR